MTGQHMGHTHVRGNASGPNITDSIVYYDEGQAAAQDVADSVARDLGGVE